MYQELFEPIEIGKLTVKNRFVVPAMLTQYCDEEGKATERYAAYLEARARGGWGLIITENHAVLPRAGAVRRVPGLWNDDQIPGHSEVVSRVHAHGAKICCQIYHAGRQTHPKVCGGQAVGPSAIRDHTRRDLPRALSEEEIGQIVEAFGNAALRAKRAGFDMVEIHGAHGYLINEFLSPFANKRKDQYGGTLFNRSRFLREVIEAVRSRVGPEYPVQLRLSAAEDVPGGIPLTETMAVALMAEELGVDSLHISQGNQASMHQMISPAAVPPGAWTEHAYRIRQVVRIPVICVGRITEPVMAQTMLKAGVCDLVSMGRASLADPDLPRKAAAGLEEEIRYCFGCVQGCIGKTARGPIRCFSNPRLGLEYKELYKQADERKKIVIAGGGIAGCEAAIVLAKRGHEVLLCEKKNTLGGLWSAAAMPPFKTEFLSLLYRQKKELEKTGVRVLLSQKVDREFLCEQKPDVLFVATGGKPSVPPIPGADGSQVVFAEDVLNGNVKTDRRVVVIGGGLAGAETACYAAQTGSTVTIAELLSRIAEDGEPASRHYLMQELKSRNVRIRTETICREIREGTVICEEKGREEAVPADQVILAVGRKPLDSLKQVGEELGLQVVCAGDAAGIKNGINNIWEAFDRALEI